MPMSGNGGLLGLNLCPPGGCVNRLIVEVRELDVDRERNSLFRSVMGMHHMVDKGRKHHQHSWLGREPHGIGAEQCRMAVKTGRRPGITQLQQTVRRTQAAGSRRFHIIDRRQMLLRMVVQTVVVAGPVYIGPAGPADLQFDRRSLSEGYELLNRAIQFSGKLPHFGLLPVEEVRLRLPAPGVADLNARLRSFASPNGFLQARIGDGIEKLLSQKQLRPEYHGQVRVELYQHCRTPSKSPPIAKSVSAMMVSRSQHGGRWQQKYW